MFSLTKHLCVAAMAALIAPAHAADLQRFIDEKLGDPDKLLKEIEASRHGRD